MYSNTGTFYRPVELILLQITPVVPGKKPSGVACTSKLPRYALRYSYPHPSVRWTGLRIRACHVLVHMHCVLLALAFAITVPAHGRLGHLHRATPNGRPFCLDFIRLGRTMGSCSGLSSDAVVVRPARGRILLPHLVHVHLKKEKLFKCQAYGPSSSRTPATKPAAGNTHPASKMNGCPRRQHSRPSK